MSFVKATYSRALAGIVGEGGRVTELTARPLLEALFPELASWGQPLAGEVAMLREVIQPIDLVDDYGVDVALLIDIAQQVGLQAMAEVNLGERAHRNRPLGQLTHQARSVTAGHSYARRRAHFSGGTLPVYPWYPKLNVSAVL